MAVRTRQAQSIAPSGMHGSSLPTAHRTLGLAALVAFCACSPTAHRHGSALRSSHDTETTGGLRATPHVPEAGEQGSVLKLLDDYGRRFGDDRATTISRLGTPNRVRTQATSNGIDTIFVLEYRGASFEFVRRTANHRDYLMEFRVWEQLPGLPPAISLGSTTRSNVVTMLGPPQYSAMIADSAVISYEAPGGPDLIEVYVVRDTVRVLRWRYRMG
jgi:hypothetical protein